MVHFNTPLHGLEQVGSDERLLYVLKPVIKLSCLYFE
jgi:hypothetical protein